MPLEKVDVELGFKLMNEEPDCNAREVPGLVVPMPTLPKLIKSTNLDVEEAINPFVNQMGVDVELTAVAKFVFGV